MFVRCTGSPTTPVPPSPPPPPPVGAHGQCCNQLVALVLHSPGERPAEGGERNVKMDVWRIWSQKKGNAQFHQMVLPVHPLSPINVIPSSTLDHNSHHSPAPSPVSSKAMREIAQYYKYGRDGQGGHVPNLQRVKVKSDGQRSQYKGRKNFGLMSAWPHLPVEGFSCACKPNAACCEQKLEPGLGIEMWHDFPPSHHGSGPVDSYGKDARKAMDAATNTGATERFNARHCYR